MEVDAKLIKKITFKQFGSNCGIYALAFTINFYLAKNNKPILSKKSLRLLIGELTKEAVNQNYSIVGEFFELKKYQAFINSPEAQKTIEKYIPGLKIDAELVDRQHNVRPSQKEEFILAYVRPKNTHIVPVIDINKHQVKYVNAQKICTKKLSSRERTKFKVRSYRIKRLFIRPILFMETYIAMFIFLGFIMLLLFSNESYLSFVQVNSFVTAYSLTSISALLGYSMIFVLMNIFKIARVEEMRIELRNSKYLKDIPSIEIDKLVKVTFTL
ncbi:hypothetical protein [Lysinibacillus fusiformis]|uniref:hypothetical protein n=1 Tax=Lysinibacillus fusiformis TaxID=28031 RepID=UPI00187F486E|nr:hypothetical protein [Lysinibacillus fusiformis]MBD8523862.1 hypothetical protein [Lysinibacillus fusiformis]